MNTLHKIHFRDLQVGLSKSSYLKFGIIFNHAFLSLPQPQQYFGVFCRKPRSNSLGEGKKKKKKHLERASYNTASVSPNQTGYYSSRTSWKATMVIMQKPCQVHLFHKPYSGALTL